MVQESLFQLYQLGVYKKRPPPATFKDPTVNAVSKNYTNGRNLYNFGIKAGYIPAKTLYMNLICFKVQISLQKKQALCSRASLQSYMNICFPYISSEEQFRRD